MSFFLTTAQFINGTKDVTRRLGWAHLKPGDHFMAVEKAQGLKKGEKIRKLGECICISNYPEKLIEIDKNRFRGGSASSETLREGFLMHPDEFIKMFCKEMKCKPDTIVNRIEFKRVNP